MSRLQDWINYLEGTSEVTLFRKLSLLLRYSRTDQLIVDNLRRLRRIIKFSDPALDIEDQISDPEFLNSLHARIMKDINMDTRGGAGSGLGAGTESHEEFRGSTGRRLRSTRSQTGDKFL